MERTETLPSTPSAEGALSLVVVEGLDRGGRAVVDDEVLIGTSDQCGLVLTDPTVSRRHASIRVGPIGVILRDEESRNGTWLGDARVIEVELPPGAVFRIGGTTVRIEPASEPRTSARAAGAVEHFGRFVGSAAVLQPLYRQLQKVAATDVAVLIEGESGTGKELLAEAIHEASPRADGPFVVVDCGAIAESLVESHLFGHVKGAFTGADRSVPGAFELADGGTLFLDEIGELPLPMQTRLLRVLEQRKVRRIGAPSFVDVKLRVIAATHRNLEREVEQERFRLDLYHRLAVVALRVPPLRERLSDVPMLCRAIAARLGVDGEALAREVARRAPGARWPGNVRELRNTVERLALLGEDADVRSLETGETAGSGALDAIAARGDPYRVARAAMLRAFHQRYVQDMLARHANNVTRAAESAGIARRHFHRLKQGGGDE